MLTWNIESTEVDILIACVFLFALVFHEVLMKAVRHNEKPATIFQMIKLWYVCQIFKSMKSLTMDGCQEWCLKFKKKPKDRCTHAYNGNREAGVNMFPPCPSLFCCCRIISRHFRGCWVVGVGSFFDGFIMIQFLKLISNELMRVQVKLQFPEVNKLSIPGHVSKNFQRGLIIEAPWQLDIMALSVISCLCFKGNLLGWFTIFSYGAAQETMLRNLQCQVDFQVVNELQGEQGSPYLSTYPNQNLCWWMTLT